MNSRFTAFASPVLAATLALSIVGCACCSQSAPAPAAPAPGAKMIVSHAADYTTVTQPWGQLIWFVSGKQKNCSTMTVGKAVVKPGFESPRHVHPNCEEVLHVAQGTILHTIEDGHQVRMVAGDTITIPVGIPHNAKNIGTDDAIMYISFSSADRQAINK